jgi:hypothetical protein
MSNNYTSSYLNDVERNTRLLKQISKESYTSRDEKVKEVNYESEDEPNNGYITTDGESDDNEPPPKRPRVSDVDKRNTRLLKQISKESYGIFKWYF